jgi:hypothetical protein
MKTEEDETGTNAIKRKKEYLKVVRKKNSRILDGDYNYWSREIARNEYIRSRSYYI